MKHYICWLFALLLCGCQPAANEKEAIRVAVLRGPSAIAFAQWMEEPPTLGGRRFIVRIVDTPDLMQASLIKQGSDIAILPMINAANLYNKGIDYRLAGCPIWGTLYMVERSDISPDDEALYVFGAGANPDIITRHYLEQEGIEYHLNYAFASAREVMQALHVGRVNRAVLSEPYLGAALKRDTSLHIIADLNQPHEGAPGFAQTAILVAPSLVNLKDSLDSLMASTCRFANEQPAEAIRILEAERIFPAEMLTPESIARCKIDYRTAAESEESIYGFLSLMYEYEPKVIGGKLPNEGFLMRPAK